MPTELDKTLDAIMDKLTAEGMPAETVPFTRGGVDMPSLKLAPPALNHYFAHYCNEHKDADFLIDGDTRLTFGETWQAARHVAAGLVDTHGVAKGDRVGIAARNSANWIVAYMGILLAGGCATLLNGFSSGEELADQLELVGCKLLLADAQRAKRLDGHEHGAKIVLFEHGGKPSDGLAQIWGDPGERTFLDVGPDDYATILYTSGSTGKSKGAWSDHRGVVHGAMSYALQSLMAFTYLDSSGGAPTSQACALVAVPLFHVTGEVPVFLQSFALGRKLVLMPRWDAGEALRLMDKEKVSYFAGVPLMSYEIATHPDRAKYDISSCSGFAAGGAPRPVEHVTKIRDAFPNGFPLLGYGLTETNGVGCGNFNENYLAKPSSTGKPSRPLVDLAILDDDGNKVPQGNVGEISIRSVCNFSGYWNNEEATKAAFTKDMYFRTGDLGKLDEDGYLYIVDRKKDIIIRGGENITCIEVEEAIYAHDAIAECSVFGIPDERMGEVPAAVYYLKSGHSLTPADLREFLLASIAPFKVPLEEHIWQSDKPLPRLGTQKIDKRTVRTMHAGEPAAA
ncbi:Acyl-CoA synthetase (AMP-forming)/AMP-acid ligase II [Altererythrobacter xiamenensis]|uniref:Acyl-CoA synthetase (AMP-forming)/AMP-acid ligase II n=1 Tax=Altererythrobacter xiamenensis TaxID=1316679 RepID=A0A1Y6FSM7_9SPHN|nr:class I adenylate-forming enzyme family protein [Altererythrobacter xiamenensis]SMQ75872.1 Acyl-CoA synthetase (AMP-forming)/AMP-acid ligase II [Altererythrobacter xiamenensis]